MDGSADTAASAPPAAYLQTRRLTLRPDVLGEVLFQVRPRAAVCG
jgi:hypothetical protein